MGVLFVSAVLYGVVGIALMFCWGLATEAVRNAVPAVFATAYVRALIGSIPTLLMTPFLVATLVVLYYELRADWNRRSVGSEEIASVSA